MRKFYVDKYINKWLAFDNLDTSADHVEIVDVMANIRHIQEAAKDPYYGITLVELCDSDINLNDDNQISFYTIRDSSFADVILIRSEYSETMLINDNSLCVYLRQAVGKLATNSVFDVRSVTEVKEMLLRKYWDDQLKDKLIKFMEKTYRNIGNFIDHKQAVGMNMDKEMFNTLQRVLTETGIEPAWFFDGAYIHLPGIAERYMQSFIDRIRKTYKFRWTVRMSPMRRRMIPLPGFDFGGKIGDHTKLFPLTKMRKMSVLWR